ncbi:MAG TPA: adenine deaminase [Symbiobacteriaceae bacterium]|nr:adenine deaminase [Symbiobacteriaceae bacterium]
MTGYSGPLSLGEAQAAVAVAAGREAGTVLLTNVQVVNVFTGEIEPGPVLLAGRLIAGVGPACAGASARKVIDLEGGLVVPGFVDGHVHLESALVEPREYARAVVPRGVTTVVWDPHEWANVVGTTAFEAALATTWDLPLDVYLTASSCVSASPLETAGARLEPGDLEQALLGERVVGLGELMNYPGVVAGAPEEVEKAWRADRLRKPVDGHAPTLSGRDLQAYAAAGVGSDHECMTVAEAQEKLRLGMMIFIREGSAARNLADLLPLVTPGVRDRFCLVTDDKHPHDLVREGGVDFAVRKAVQLGLDLPTAVRLATYNPCQFFGLRRRGAVVPGYWADLAVLDPATLECRATFRAGHMVARHGHLLVDTFVPTDSRLLNTVKLPAVTAEQLQLAEPGGPVRVIGVVPGQILTRSLSLAPTVRDGQIVADPERDLAKLVVMERYGRTGGVGVGLVQGLGLKRGAIASTVAHDAHNIIVAGVDDADILAAAAAVASTGGGFAAVAGGQVLSGLALPVAGLMSQHSLADVAEGLDRLEAAVQTLGVTMPAPFMTLSFLALSVIPELKLTDQGLVDPTAGRVVGLLAD